MRTGLANMGVGILIAALGVLVTGLTYSMVSRGGGTYVVAYGAFVVGAWRFLLGLFQVLRGAFEGARDERKVFPPTSSTPRADVPAASHARDASNALPVIGGLLIAQAGLRLIFLFLLVGRMPVAAVLNNVSLLSTGIVLPFLLVIGGVAAGALCLRNRPEAVAFGIGLCVVGLLFQAYGLPRLLSVSQSHLAWVPWLVFTVHVAIYVAGLIVFVRSIGRHDVLRGAAG